MLLHEKLARMKAGDRDAANELMMGVYQRMVRLSRKMFSRFPNVGRWTDCDDVLQNALLRLLKTLETVRPNTMRDFYTLAAVHLRRELLDLARFFARRDGTFVQSAEGAFEAPRTMSDHDACARSDTLVTARPCHALCERSS